MELYQSKYITNVSGLGYKYLLFSFYDNELFVIKHISNTMGSDFVECEKQTTFNINKIEQIKTILNSFGGIEFIKYDNEKILNFFVSIINNIC